MLNLCKKEWIDYRCRNLVLGVLHHMQRGFKDTTRVWEEFCGWVEEGVVAAAVEVGKVVNMLQLST